MADTLNKEQIRELYHAFDGRLAVTYKGKPGVVTDLSRDEDKAWVVPGKSGKGRGWWRPLNEITFT